MPPATPPRPDLAALVAHYRDLLGLRDWTIVAEWRDDMPDALAQVLPTPARKLALVYVSTACPLDELRASVVHELVHALLSPLVAVSEPSGAAIMLEEQAVEALALAVVRAEQSPNDSRALARALARLAPQMRARVSAQARRTRYRMDPKVLAALALEGGALMGMDGLPEEAAAWIKKAVEVMSGGAPSAEPDGDEAPVATSARPDKGEDDEEDDDKDEMYRKRSAADPVRVLGARVLARVGGDPLTAWGKLGAKLDAADRLPTVQASADDAKRRKIWEDLARSRKVRLTQALTREEYQDADGKPAERVVYAKWAKRQNDLYPEIESLEAWAASLTPEPGATSIEPATVLADAAHAKHAAAQFNERDRLEAKRAGVDPDVLAAQIKMMNGGRSADERV